MQPQIRVRRVRIPTWLLRKKAKQVEAAGRNVGAVIGSWVTDLMELKQQIFLCSACEPRLRGGEGKYGYHRDTRWNEQYGGIIAKCDACREGGPGRRMYVHESYFGKTYDP